MTHVLIDTNVVIDIVGEDPVWRDWSECALADALLSAPTIVNPVVYAELAARYDRVEDIDGLLRRLGLQREDLPWPAAFLAGRAHLDYRSRGGDRRTLLPDFFIGAHAAVRRYRLLTRDARRYRTYFPTVELICPDSE